MKIFDLTYYFIYCNVIYKTKYSEISKNYMEFGPHKEARRMFLMATIFYFFLFAYATKILLIIPDRGARSSMAICSTLFIYILFYLYLSNTIKLEKIVLHYNKSRNGLLRRDGFLGMLFYVGSFFSFFTVVIVKFIFKI